MTELINFPDGTTQHAYLTTDNANDDLEIAVLDGDLVILDTNENPVLRWDASATQWDFVSQDVVGVGSFATGEVTVGGHDTIQGIEVGDVSHSDPGTATDNGWDTSTVDTQSVSFGATFANTPEVVITQQTSFPGGAYEAITPSTTGFSSQLRWYRGDASTGPTANWVAIGE